MLSCSLYYLPEDGVALQMRCGALCARAPDSTVRLFEPRVHGLRVIVLAGHGASITSEAIRWCGREGVSLYVMERNGEAFAVIAEAVEADGRRRALSLRQKQFKAHLEPQKRLEIARKIVSAKLRTLSLHPIDARGFRQELAAARKLEDILTVEARAGAAYFMQYRGTDMPFKDEVPSHWGVFTARAGTAIKGRSGTSKARHAATPWGAALNYAYTVALAQCVRACVGLGLDPMHGFLHSPKPGRTSLAYDALELHRAALTEVVFEYGSKRYFRSGDFETEHGIVRLSPGVARDVAGLAIKTASMADCVASVRRIASWF
jgi:CRISPR-associated protein Cas1